MWERTVAELSAGRPAPPEAGLLTSKPTLVVANVGEGEPISRRRSPRAARSRSAPATRRSWPSSSRARRARCARSWGSEQGALEALVRATYRLLGLITFFTAVGGNEIRARSLRQGSTAYDAAGSVHTDMQRGFVRAEVIGWDELVDGRVLRGRPGCGPAAHRGPRLRRRRRRRDHDQVHPVGPERLADRRRVDAHGRPGRPARRHAVDPGACRRGSR